MGYPIWRRLNIAEIKYSNISSLSRLRRIFLVSSYILGVKDCFQSIVKHVEPFFNSEFSFRTDLTVALWVIPHRKHYWRLSQLVKLFKTSKIKIKWNISCHSCVIIIIIIIIIIIAVVVLIIIIYCYGYNLK